jgi:hypothetical protein
MLCPQTIPAQSKATSHAAHAREDGYRVCSTAPPTSVNHQALTLMQQLMGGVKIHTFPHVNTLFMWERQNKKAAISHFHVPMIQL